MTALKQSHPLLSTQWKSFWLRSNTIGCCCDRPETVLDPVPRSWNGFFVDCEGGEPCHLVQSCHKSTQDSLCFQFSSRKAEQLHSCAQNYFFLTYVEFLPECCSGWFTSELYMPDLWISLLTFPPWVATSPLPKLKEGQERKFSDLVVV